jgi:hypothetical protein
MKKENIGRGMACPYCKSEMRDGKCSGCGAWVDSYGIIHRPKCQGGFHEECPGKGGQEGKKKDEEDEEDGDDEDDDEND